MALALLAAAACAGPRVEAPQVRPSAASGTTSRETPAASTATPPAPAARVAAPDAVSIVTDVATLKALEDRGFSLGARLGGKPRRTHNRELFELSRYRSLVAALERELDALLAADPLAGVGVHRFSHRAFDRRWLRADTAHFELIAVVNRIDRAPFRPDRCGETRLVYRLAYATTVKGATVSSRLPMTVGFELQNRRGDATCAATLDRFRIEPGLAPEVAAERLASGPLSSAALDTDASGHRLVMNVQLVRWPSTIRPDLAGHAEYLLRSFTLDANGSAYVEAPLENTPDLARLRGDQRLTEELIAWLSEPAQLRALDAGTLVIPERFLAKRSISVTPRGLSRGANTPFTTLFDEKRFEAVDFSKLSRVRSAAGLLRRLDTLSCAGCHEARSLAGFHLLGDDPPGTPAANGLAVSRSPHLEAELVRRTKLARAIASEATPDFSVPFAERGPSGGYGAHCGLGADPSFAGWTCAEGLTCMPLDAPTGDAVGQCLPSEPSGAGDPCETGPLTRNADPRRDRVSRVARATCARNAACNTNQVGFPGGMCTESCSDLAPSSVCGAIAVLDPFNACVARGESFATCLATHVRPAGLRACSAENPCRDDYLCAGSSGRGACIPPYFVFQLRVDGHP
jgi:hypothetical protein